ADGGYAEQCLAPASHVFAIPDGVSFEAAATFPTCFLTATHALFDRAALQPGETVMIHAAASGVSVAAIQLAKRRGATVLATAGSELKMERALELGADHVLNNRTGDVTGWAFEATQGRGVDLVFDHVGEALFAASLFSLSPRGRLVTCGNTSGDTATIASLGHLFHTGISIIGSDAYRPDEFAPAWSDFCAGVASGQYRVEVDDTYPLDGVADAQERLLAGDVVGKLVITPQV
ncbi:MAG: zinc-binding dehydrogenase, partial [Actinomycetota bacterium]